MFGRDDGTRHEASVQVDRGSFTVAPFYSFNHEEDSYQTEIASRTSTLYFFFTDIDKTFLGAERLVPE